MAPLYGAPYVRTTQDRETERRGGSGHPQPTHMVIFRMYCRYSFKKNQRKELSSAGAGKAYLEVLDLRRSTRSTYRYIVVPVCHCHFGGCCLFHLGSGCEMFCKRPCMLVKSKVNGIVQFESSGTVILSFSEDASSFHPSFDLAFATPIHSVHPR